MILDLLLITSSLSIRKLAGFGNLAGKIDR
jgi:hypothetical protein